MNASHHDEKPERALNGWTVEDGVPLWIDPDEGMLWTLGGLAADPQIGNAALVALIKERDRQEGDTMNATITVTYGDRSVTIELNGTELSDTGHRYLSNASRGFVADEVERALLDLTEG